jgi:hypothetical protein
MGSGCILEPMVYLYRSLALRSTLSFVFEIIRKRKATPECSSVLKQANTFTNICGSFLFLPFFG